MLTITKKRQNQISIFTFKDIQYLFYSFQFSVSGWIFWIFPNFVLQEVDIVGFTIQSVMKINAC